jgi:hypothetical protein
MWWVLWSAAGMYTCSFYADAQILRAAVYMMANMSPPKPDTVVNYLVVARRVQKLIRERITIPDIHRLIASYDAWRQEQTLMNNQLYTMKGMIGRILIDREVFEGHVHGIQERRKRAVVKV